MFLISVFLILLWLSVRRLCSSLLFSPLFLLDPFDAVLSFFKHCSSTCSEGDSVAGEKPKKKKKKKKLCKEVMSERCGG